jgi:hypothetical protein
MKAQAYFFIVVVSGWVAATGVKAEPGLDIEDPPGMRSIVTRENGVTHIRFVPKTNAAPAATPATADVAADVTADGDAKPLTNKSTAKQAPVESTKVADKLYSLNLDRPINAVPAFVALDLTPETVAHPDSPRDFAAALLNGVDRNGVLQHGIAMETAPFRMLPFVRTDIKKYQKSYLTQLLYNFSFSLATSKASDKSDAVQLALGFNAIVFESTEHDPRRNADLTAAFDKTNREHPVISRSTNTAAADIPDEDPVAKKIMQDEVTKFRKNSWVGAIWAIAAAPTWNSDSGKLTELSGTGFSAWTTFAYGFPSAIVGDSIRLQLLGHLRYREGEHVVDPNDKAHTANQDTFIAAARARLGATDFNGFVETGYVRVSHGLTGNAGAWRSAAGIEKKIGENLWFVLSAGEQFGATASKTSELFAVGSIRLGSSDTPQLEPK